MRMPSILIVDDEPDLASLLQFNLEEAGYETQVVHSGSAALAAAARKTPALVLLDVMLPDISGYEVCRLLRAGPSTAHVPVVMLTARGDEAERVQGLEAGADDYVTKPFNVREMVLRVKAVLRRAGQAKSDEPATLSLGALTLDVAAHRCSVEGKDVPLTALEFRLLHHLMSRTGRVQTRARLLGEVWGLQGELETRTVDTHVLRLRDKLGAARDLVETVRGIGYRMAEGARPLA
jgi:two-component system, OmpR family, phosphate regulon response regulator PhoB